MGAHECCHRETVTSRQTVEPFSTDVVVMGVPAFFRWLSRKYPSVVVDAVEEKPRDVNGTRVPVNVTGPNPNNQEFDNLYLDMNGIIHPCTHPEDRPAPKNEDEMFALIFEYIDRLFAIVRPRRLLYMAIDGVAPRAKMNQQRSRRFRASKEAAEKLAQIDEVRSRLEKEGIPLPPKKDEGEHFDSNCITPGTPFMARLADALRYYVHMRLNNDPGWAKIEVILSDANVPGEGEHKIMDFIRRQRASPSHDPNTVHCLCGADADLIMLGLATHEANFNIIREEFVPNQQRPCELCGQYGHELKDCQGLAQDEAAECQANPMQKETNFIFIRIPVLREYLERELQMPNSPIPFNLERAIDDWVFMCFFVGNDFLPHLPSLEIRENAIDRLIKLYKDMVAKMGGYLTDSGNVHMERVQMILDGLGEVEDEIFKTRQQKEVAYRKRLKMQRKRERSASAPSFVPSPGSLIAPHANGPAFYSGADTRQMARDARIEAMEYTRASQRLNSMLLPVGESNEFKRKAESESDSDEEPFDEVRLWESGWKERYYKSKFDVSGEDIAFRHKVAWAYVEGLCWVLKYYYQGCASWDWYFPYHYAPFASDFTTVSKFVPDFSAPTEPFKPLQQLMSVFPAASRKHLPESWQHLMTDIDSPIIDFYPDDFQIDLNGKKYAWQGVALLPFVDEKRLLETLSTVEWKLNSAEKERNSRGPDRIFVGPQHPACSFLERLYKGGNDANSLVELDTLLTKGLAGKVRADVKVVLPGEHFFSPIPLECCPDIERNMAIMAVYENPQFEKGFVFPAKRLPGAVDVPRVLKPANWDLQEPYRPQIGFSSLVPRGYLADAGHRMLSHELGSQRSFNAVGYQTYSQRVEHPRQAYNQRAELPRQPYSPRVEYPRESRYRPNDAGWQGRSNGVYERERYRYNEYSSGPFPGQRNRNAGQGPREGYPGPERGGRGYDRGNIHRSSTFTALESYDYGRIEERGRSRRGGYHGQDAWMPQNRRW